MRGIIHRDQWFVIDNKDALAGKGSQISVHDGGVFFFFLVCLLPH
jgi:hypothetical protein